MMVTNVLDEVSKKMIFGRKTAFLAQNRAILVNWGRKTAHRAAEWAPSVNLKVPRVASGYGGDMFLLNRTRLSPKYGGYMGVA